MKTFAERIKELSAVGYRLADAQTKVAHDAILLAMHKSGFKKNSTIKGGVVMCEITKDRRRTTMDIDFDVIRYSISDLSIQRLIRRLARLSGFSISIFGTITELRQDDYRGKRLFVDVNDGSLKRPVRTKIDIGVHTLRELHQVECRFEALASDKKASLFVNSKEQIFAEKLLSLIKHGFLSTRQKDVFDMYYLSKHVKLASLRRVLRTVILDNRRCAIRDPRQIVNFVADVFSSKRFMKSLANPKVNWLQLSPDMITSELLRFLQRVFLGKQAGTKQSV